ncbi:MAG: portal protein [Metamycoplasmataceae bacterium]
MAEQEREGLAADGAKNTYERLKNDRNDYIVRAESCAQYTIPSLFPKDSDNGGTNYQTPWQGIGARGLNNLAAKLMLALFPVGSPFFKLNVSEMEVKQLSGDPSAIQEVTKGLSMVERIVLNYMDANSFRPALFDVARQLIVAGNCLLYIPRQDEMPEGLMAAPKAYRLSSYVVERDGFDNILQIVTLDMIARAALPEDILATVEANGEGEPAEEFEVYTHIYRDPESGTFKSYQEVDGQIVDGTDGEYPLDGCPWIPVRCIKIAGEDYGRSFVEEYLGDLKSLENLYEAMVKMSMIAAKVLFLVNPNGVTQVRRIAKANTGDFVAGRKQDIEVFQLEKGQDFNTAKAIADSIETRLSRSFLLNSSVQRGGERVTAEEIRYVAGELEETLGGVYSILSQELQLPLVRILLKNLEATKKIPNLPKEAIEPAVATGLEALGRGHDLDKLKMFLDMIVSLAKVQDEDLNMADLKLRVANSLGIDSEGLLLTEEQKQQKMAVAAQQQAMMQGGGAMGAAAGQMGAEMGAQAMQEQM